MKKSDDEDNNILEPLLKRRTQLAAIIEHRRKNMNRSSKDISSKNGVDENLQERDTEQVKMTTLDHQNRRANRRVNSDVIEDSEEEMSFDLPKKFKPISSDNEIDSITLMPHREALVDNSQTTHVKEQQRNPNKVVKVLSTLIIKKSTDTGKNNYLEAPKSNRSSHNAVHQKKKIFLPLIQAYPQPIQEVTLPSEEPQEEACPDISQQPTLPSKTFFTKFNNIVASDPENFECKNEAAVCEFLHKLPQVPSQIFEEAAQSCIVTNSLDISGTNIQQFRNSPSKIPKVADFSCFETHKDNLDASCDDRQQPLNSHSKIHEEAHLSCSETHKNNLDISDDNIQLLPNLPSKIPGESDFYCAEIHKDHLDVTGENMQQLPNSPFEIPEEADLSCAKAYKDKLDTSPTGSLQQIPLSSSETGDIKGACMTNLDTDNIGNKSDGTFCDSRQQSPNLLGDITDAVCGDDITFSEDQYKGSRPGTSFLQKSVKTSLLGVEVLLTEKDASNLSESNKTPVKVRPKRKRRRISKLKAFIDYLSDEDMQDFSSGSSNLWSCNESSVSSDENQNISKKKKKRKKKIDKCETKNTEIKKKENKINSRRVNKKLKDTGKSYENRKGDIVSEKEIKPNPCVKGKCARGCYDIPEERRTALFQYFWDLDAQRRRDWIVRCTHSTPIKRKKTKNCLSRRQLTYQYFVNAGEGHKQVCQKFILDTLDITQKYIIYTVENAREGMAKEDLRKPNISTKYTEETKTNARNFIEKLPAVPSHYNRKKTNKVYLPQEMKNVTNLYRMYLKSCLEENLTSLSEHAFRTIFKEYNISFHIPKKDKCVICVKAENNKDEMSNNEKASLIAHHKEKKATYKRFKRHQVMKTLTNDTITCSFDLQKVLNTPHGQSMLLYYSRKYSVFNFTIYESGTQEVYCFTWGECDGKRGSNEIATCLVKYLKEKDKQGLKHLVMYCDSCSGQNKNKNVLAAVNHFLKSAMCLEVVQINYLLPGHTYMPVDTVHAVIEREVRKVIVWSPSQWSTYFESARKNPRPYKVNVLDFSDFLNFDQLAANEFTPMTSKAIKFKDMRVATFKKKYEGQVFVKYSMEDDAQTHTIILKEKRSVKGKGRGKGRKLIKKTNDQVNNESLSNNESQVDKDIVTQLYNSRLPIAAAKYKDLINLCNNGTIPKRFHGEYRELPNDSQTQDTLNETDEEDEPCNEKEN